MSGDPRQGPVHLPGKLVVDLKDGPSDRRASGGRIVLDAADLDDVPRPADVDGGPRIRLRQRASFFRVGRRTGVAFGLIGSALGMGLWQVCRWLPAGWGLPGLPASAASESAGLVALAVVLGGLLGAAEGAHVGSGRMAVRGGLIGAALGAAGGLAAAYWPLLVPGWIGRLWSWMLLAVPLAAARMTLRRSAPRLRCSMLVGVGGGLLVGGIVLLWSAWVPAGSDVGRFAGLFLEPGAAAALGVLLPVSLGWAERGLCGAFWIVLAGPMAGATIPLRRRSLVVGRGDGCDIPLCRDRLLDVQHAALTCKGDRSTIRDLHDWPTIRVNGRPVLACPLVDGDQIELGGTVVEHRVGR